MALRHFLDVKMVVASVPQVVPESILTRGLSIVSALQLGKDGECCFRKQIEANSTVLTD